MSEKAIFDLRIWVTAETASEVYRLATLFVDRSREAAPDGVDVRYSQIRRGHPSSAFKPTMGGTKPAARGKRR